MLELAVSSRIMSGNRQTQLQNSVLIVKIKIKTPENIAKIPQIFIPLSGFGGSCLEFYNILFH